MWAIIGAVIPVGITLTLVSQLMGAVNAYAQIQA